MENQKEENQSVEGITFWHTNSIVKFIWNILFACFFPILLTFSFLASGFVWLTSTIVNLIFKFFKLFKKS